jgi:hypothetical protein
MTMAIPSAHHFFLVPVQDLLAASGDPVITEAGGRFSSVFVLASEARVATAVMGGASSSAFSSDPVRSQSMSASQSGFSLIVLC